MNSLVRPELPTAALRSSQATLAAVDNSAPLPNRPESTYKSGKVVHSRVPSSLASLPALAGLLMGFDPTLSESVEFFKLFLGVVLRGVAALNPRDQLLFDQIG